MAGAFLLLWCCSESRHDPALPGPRERILRLERAGASVSVDRGSPEPAVDVDFPAPVTDDVLGLLRGVANLRVVRVLAGGATDGGLAAMGPQPRLELLVLVRSPSITDAGLATIASFAALTKLDVQSEHVTAAGLGQLAKPPKLRELYLYGSTLSDADLVPLARLKTVQFLDLPGSVSPEAVDRLQRAMPGTQVKVVK